MKSELSVGGHLDPEESPFHLRHPDYEATRKHDYPVKLYSTSRCTCQEGDC